MCATNNASQRSGSTQEGSYTVASGSVLGSLSVFEAECRKLLTRIQCLFLVRDTRELYVP